jgi:hypothetical protein
MDGGTVGKVAVGKLLNVGKMMRAVAVQTKGVGVAIAVQTGRGRGVTDQTSQALNRSREKNRLIFFIFFFQIALAF